MVASVKIEVEVLVEGDVDPDYLFTEVKLALFRVGEHMHDAAMTTERGELINVLQVAPHTC